MTQKKYHRKPQGYDHHRRLFHENSKYIWYINSYGYFERYMKREEEDITESNFERLEGFYDYNRSQYLVNIDKREYIVKREIGKFFNRDFAKDMIIMHKNKDWKDCNIENLIFISKKDYVNKTHPNGRRKTKVVLRNKATGYQQTFDSVTALAKFLHIDYSNLYKYMHFKRKTSYLDQFEIVKVSDL